MAFSSIEAPPPTVCPPEGNDERIADAVRTLLAGLGEDPAREGLVKTPERVAKALRFLTSGYDQDVDSVINDALFTVDYSEMVIVKDIDFYSLCEHHLLPFFGRVHIGYVPNGKIAGASKLPRTVEVLARRPQLQERMTAQIADTIYDTLRPDGVAVVVEAEHLCMSMRGVRKEGSRIVTSATRGPLDRCGMSKAELLAIVQGTAR
jgi:GTP cyclohydrolase I